MLFSGRLLALLLPNPRGFALSGPINGKMVGQFQHRVMIGAIAKLNVGYNDMRKVNFLLFRIVKTVVSFSILLNHPHLLTQTLASRRF